jgi:hypothetical protein
MPYTFIIAIDPNGASLELQPYGSKGYKHVKIPHGAMILFAGDILHGGSAYQEMNIRIHGYFKTEMNDMPTEPSLYEPPHAVMPYPATQLMYDEWKLPRGSGTGQKRLAKSRKWGLGQHKNNSDELG